MENTIAWIKFNEYAEKISTSKIHTLDDDGNCLCGVAIPSVTGYEVGSGWDYGHDECKKCQKKKNGSD